MQVDIPGDIYGFLGVLQRDPDTAADLGKAAATLAWDSPADVLPFIARVRAYAIAKTGESYEIDPADYRPGLREQRWQGLVTACDGLAVAIRETMRKEKADG